MEYRKVNVTGSSTATTYQSNICMRIGTLVICCDSDNIIRIQDTRLGNNPYLIYGFGNTGPDSNITSFSGNFQITPEWFKIPGEKRSLASFQEIHLFNRDTNEYFVLYTFANSEGGNVHVEGIRQPTRSVLGER